MKRKLLAFLGLLMSVSLLVGCAFNISNNSSESESTVSESSVEDEQSSSSSKKPSSSSSSSKKPNSSSASSSSSSVVSSSSESSSEESAVVSSSNESSSEESSSESSVESSESSSEENSSESSVESSVDSGSDEESSSDSSSSVEEHVHTAIEWKSDETKHWRECECGENFDEAEHAVATWEGVIDANMKNGVCVCGKGLVTINTAMSGRQELLLTEETATINLSEIGADVKVTSIPYGEADLVIEGNEIVEGKYTLSLAGIDAASQYGEKNLGVYVETADGASHYISVPVLLVTKVINSIEDLEVVKYTGPKQASEEGAYAIRGYYILGGDIDGEGAVFSGATNAWNAGIGFCGTLDGRNYKITNFSVSDNGLFGNASQAVLKNITLEVNSVGPYLLANAYRGGKIENVAITVKEEMSSTWGGLLAGEISGVEGVNCEVSDVTIDTDYLKSAGAAVFCQNPVGVTCTDVTIKTLSTNPCVAEGNTLPAGVTVEEVVFDEITVDTEFLALGETADVTLTSDKFIAGETVTVNGTEVVVETEGEIMVSLGEVNAGSVNTVVCASKTFVVTYTNILAVTKVINSMEDLEVVKYTGPKQASEEGAYAIRGYYILGSDIDGEGAVFSGATNAWNAGIGFCGTLDGRNYKITNFSVSDNGLFGNASQAVLKNITLEVNSVGPYLLANAYRGGKIENVNIKIKTALSSTWGGMIAGEISGVSGENCQMTNVTIDTGILSGGTFNVFCQNPAAVTCTDVTIKTLSSNQLVATDKTLPAGVTVISGDDATGYYVEGENGNVTFKNEKFAVGDSVTANGATYTVETAGELTVALSGMEIGKRTSVAIVAESYEILYSNVLAVTKVIKTLEDLSAVMVADTGVQIFGYYVLGNDIDGQGAQLANTVQIWNQNNGFRGTFDGAGHTISNFNTGNYGIFGNIAYGAVIKDLNLEVNKAFSNVLAYAIRSATITNVNVTIASVAMPGWYELASEINTSTVSNLTVTYDESIVLSGGYALCKSQSSTFASVVIKTATGNAIVKDGGVPSGVTVEYYA